MPAGGFPAAINPNLEETMKPFSSFKPQLRKRAGLLVAVAIVYALSIAGLRAADAKPGTDPKAEKKAEKAEKKGKKLTGAELYAVHCNRCHAERYPTEFNAEQWKSLMLHMRVRANLPAAQAKTILKYMQEEAGN